MIDCHAHAYPTLADRLAPLAPHAAERLAELRAAVDRVPFARGLLGAAGGAFRSVLGSARVDVERLAELRKKSDLARDYEPLLATLALPQVIAAGTIARLYQSMVDNGIDATVLIASEPIASNEWVLEQAAASGGRLIPVVNVPSMRDDATDEQWTDALVELADAGARGLKIHLNMDGLGADHRGYRAVFEVAERLDLFVIVHTGCFKVPGYKRHEDAEPALFAPLFSDHPDVRACLAHMNRDAPEKAWDAMRRFDNVWADTSWQPRDAIERAVREVGSERLLLGSDFPLLHGDLQRDVVQALREAVDDDTAEAIGDANARAFLGLDDDDEK